MELEKEGRSSIGRDCRAGWKGSPYGRVGDGGDSGVPDAFGWRDRGYRLTRGIGAVIPRFRSGHSRSVSGRTRTCALPWCYSSRRRRDLGASGQTGSELSKYRRSGVPRTLPTAEAGFAEHGTRTGRFPNQFGGPTTAWTGSSRAGVR